MSSNLDLYDFEMKALLVCSHVFKKARQQSATVYNLTMHAY